MIPGISKVISFRVFSWTWKKLNSKTNKESGIHNRQKRSANFYNCDFRKSRKF